MGQRHRQYSVPRICNVHVQFACIVYRYIRHTDTDIVNFGKWHCDRFTSTVAPSAGWLGGACSELLLLGYARHIRSNTTSQKKEKQKYSGPSSALAMCNAVIGASCVSLSRNYLLLCKENWTTCSIRHLKKISGVDRKQGGKTHTFFLVPRHSCQLAVGKVRGKRQ